MCSLLLFLSFVYNVVCVFAHYLRAFCTFSFCWSCFWCLFCSCLHLCLVLVRCFCICVRFGVLFCVCHFVCVCVLYLLLVGWHVFGFVYIVFLCIAVGPGRFVFVLRFCLRCGPFYFASFVVCFLPVGVFFGMCLRCGSCFCICLTQWRSIFAFLFVFPL